MIRSMAVTDLQGKVMAEIGENAQNYNAFLIAGHSQVDDFMQLSVSRVSNSHRMSMQREMKRRQDAIFAAQKAKIQ